MLIFKFLSHKIKHAIYLIKSLRSIKFNLNIISTIRFNGNFPWTTPPPAENCPPWNFPRTFPPDFCLWIITPGQLPPGQLPPMKFPPGQFSPDFCPPDNCPWIIPPWILLPGQLPPMKSPQDNYSPEFCSEDNYLWMVTPGQLPPRQLPPWNSREYQQYKH